jgi:hypothetical protein
MKDYTSTSAIYKYKINELLIKQFGIYHSHARTKLYNELGITRQTLAKDANILLSSSEVIPPARMAYYVQFFKLQNAKELTNE